MQGLLVQGLLVQGLLVQGLLILGMRRLVQRLLTRWVARIPDPRWLVQRVLTPRPRRLV